MKLIIQIPCLNEANTLHLVLADLPDSIPEIDVVETLVIDDGSTDGTSATALGLGVHHVVRHRRNRGLAVSFASGLNAALDLGADIIVNTDGDHQYPGKHVSELIAPILAGRADIVIGDRRPECDRRNPLLKRFLYRMGRFAVSWIVGQRIPDPVSGFRAYSREAADRMHVATRYSYTLETLVQAIDAGMAIEFVPIVANASTRPSRLYRSQAQFVLRSAATLLRVFFMFHPLQTLMWVSAFIGMTGTIPIGRFILFYSIGQGQGHLQSLVLGTALVIVAALTLVSGLVADLVSQNRRLLESSKERNRETSKFTTTETKHYERLQKSKTNSSTNEVASDEITEHDFHASPTSEPLGFDTGMGNTVRKC